MLGGGYSARLNQEIRIRRGLSYGSGSSLDARADPGPFMAVTQTRNDAAAEVLGLILAEMRRLGAEPIPSAELVARRASLTGDFGRNAETTSGVAGPDRLLRHARHRARTRSALHPLGDRGHAGRGAGGGGFADLLRTARRW